MTAKVAVKSNSGINVNNGSGNYLDAFPQTADMGAGNVGYFYKTMTNAKFYGCAETREGNAYTGGAALLAGGSLSYNLTSHTLTGKLNTISLGEELNGVTGTYGISSTKMSLGSTDVTFGGLGLNSAKGDDVHAILYGLMTSEPDAFLAMLKKTAIKFTGGAGDDEYVAGNKADMLQGKGGGDVLKGGGGADVLKGGGGADVLNGGGGNDKLHGDGGADHLTGGAGKDVFIFKSTATSTTDAADTITDFKVGHDRIDLHQIDANTTRSGNQAFHFVGENAFSGKAGELRYEKTGDATWLYGDVDGDGAADLAIQFSSALTLREASFML